MNKTVDGYRVIANPSDVAQFFMYIVFERGCDIHPDDGFEMYVDKDGNPSFAADEVECYNSMLDASFGICETFKVDIYAICMRVLALYHFCDGNDVLTKVYDAFITYGDE